MVYLDNAATTFPKPEGVYIEVMKALQEYGANPGRSGHKLALQAGRVIYETREILAELFNIENPMNIVFTNNATEGLNIAIKGLLKSGDHVITSSMEHNSVLRPLKALEKKGVETTIIQCDEKGFININDIKNSIKENTKAIITTHASNVTGTIFPIKEIGQLAKENNIVYILDGAQTAGVYDIDVKYMNIDILVAPGHKSLLGPQGTGFIYIKEGLCLDCIKEGGTGSSSESLFQPEMMPDKFESGTPNTPGIAGLGAGVKYILDKGIENIRSHEKELTKYFLDELKKINDVIIYGPCDVEKQAPVISINIKDQDSSEVGYVLDNIFDIGVRTGLHCASLAHKTIGTLEQGTIRFSIGYSNTKEEIDLAITAIKQIIEEI
ncbi:cysteine desulfurase CsdB [Gottschalkia acidurici 9a]|uniref:cysteine desulfurase n=1 Tax=Gottschalkia acidurici (strain ATCC 7906 / DSM 604 / BCRC 14475 / CIP 104303 / KCTC 5404 / NCIMB 10678 / 9a) TaxID=1128398 RepID=K0B1K4_GOTA9|nr:aminotransferase class V-fold PLP-dependent enzyme [Gottschalkia acidurici]AFS79863.1 cysteine desulfurase CsdB [Gottschalkia acidurici 9a]